MVTDIAAELARRHVLHKRLVAACGAVMIAGDLTEQDVAAALDRRPGGTLFGLHSSTAALVEDAGVLVAEAHARWSGLGKPKRSKLDMHEAFILGLIESDDREITLAEIAERLESERGVNACVTTVHEYFAKRGISYKKDGARHRTAASRRSAARKRFEQ